MPEPNSEVISILPPEEVQHSLAQYGSIKTTLQSIDTLDSPRFAEAVKRVLVLFDSSTVQPQFLALQLLTQ
jgi:hypothetical protein